MFYVKRVGFHKEP